MVPGGRWQNCGCHVDLQFFLKAYETYKADPAFLVKLFYSYYVNVRKTDSGRVLNELKQLDPTNPEISRLEMLYNVLQ